MDKPIHRNHANASRLPEEVRAAARILFESDPTLNVVAIGERVGIHYRTLENWIAEGGWVKAKRKASKPMVEQAQALADTYTHKVADFGPEVTDDQKRQALAEVTTGNAVTIRAELIDRHRREWGAIRSMVYNQLNPKVQMSDKDRFEKAKLAKISAETMQIIQQNERKAWGMETVDPTMPSVITIERD